MKQRHNETSLALYAADHSWCDLVKGAISEGWVYKEFMGRESNRSIYGFILIRNCIKLAKFLAYALKQVKEYYLSAAGLDHEFTS